MVPQNPLRASIADSHAARFITTGRPRPVLYDDATFDLARTWLSTCHEEHSSCSVTRPFEAPPRVLDVGTSKASQKIKLRSYDRGIGSYAALSYCWGIEQPASLTESRLQQYMDSIDIKSLPLTFQDAIKVVRELGIQYLWVGASEDSVMLLSQLTSSR